jgi:hypothetical protein
MREIIQMKDVGATCIPCPLSASEGERVDWSAPTLQQGQTDPTQNKASEEIEVQDSCGVGTSSSRTARARRKLPSGSREENHYRAIRRH